MSPNETLKGAALKVRADHRSDDPNYPFWTALADAMDQVAFAVRIDAGLLHRVGYGEVHEAAKAYLAAEVTP